MQISKKIISKIKERDIYKIKFINDNNYSIEFYNFGGYFNSVSIPYRNNPNKKEDVLLGYNNINNYQKDKISLNALVGRVCGRIRNGKFKLNNNIYNLSLNDNKHHIHGGKKGFSKNIWKIENIENKSNYLKCTLSYFSKHLEEGYPGNLNCLATYILDNDNNIKIEFSAIGDQDTIVNMTNHNYWHFHGHKDYYQNINQHYICIKSDFINELDSNYLPTGKLLKVEKSKYNLKKLTKIDNNLLSEDGIDTCYLINKTKNVKQVAKVYSNLTKMGMILYTDQPGLQFYTGNMMAKKYYGKYNKKYGYQHGLCLEAQLFPDAINHSSFISPILRAGDKYTSKIYMNLRNDF